MEKETNKEQVNDSSMPPLASKVDTEGALWEAPSWRPLAAAGGVLGTGAGALAGVLFARRKGRGAIAAAGAGLALAGSAYAAASFMVNEFLGAPHSVPLTDEERTYLAENPDGELAEHYRHVERIGRMICGAKPDSWEGYYQVLEPEEVERLRTNRAHEEQLTWEWSQTVTLSEEQITAEDSVTLVAHVCEPRPESRKWAILVHGYHGCWNEMSQYAHHWAERGYNLLFPEMRGHGGSGGNLIGMGWLDRRDLIAWMQWLVSYRGEGIDIVLQGHSMGAASVMLASAEEDLPEQVKATIADCGYSDALNVLAPILRDGFRVPVHPALDIIRLSTLLKRGGYDLALASPEAVAQKISVPTLILHGERDTFVPPYMAQRIYNALPEGRRGIATFPGAGHCQSMCSNPGRYWEEVFSFVG